MTAAYDPYISVIIPAFNEEERIAATIPLVSEFLREREWSHEIIVVDDGSRDDTTGVVREMAKECPELFLLESSRNLGKGAAVRSGMLRASGRYRLFSDADLSTPIEEVHKLLAGLAEGYDVAIGSRSVPGADVKLHQPIYREAMGRVFNRIVRCLTVRGIIDTQCGFKCFRGDVAAEVFARQTLNGFCFDVESLYIAGRLGYSITEIPVTWLNSADSRVNPLPDSLKMLVDLFRIRARHTRRSFREARRQD